MEVSREVREDLGRRLGKREQFYGEFVRVGSKRGKRGGEPTFLLKDVRSKGGMLVTDHLWFNRTKGFKELGFVEPGELIQFSATVTDYVKGYVGKRPDKVDESKLGLSTDFKLERPMSFKRFLGEAGQRVSTSNKRHKKNSKNGVKVERASGGYEIFSLEAVGGFSTLDGRLKKLVKEEPRLLLKTEVDVVEILSYSVDLDRTLREAKDRVYQDKKKYGARSDRVVCLVVPDKLRTVKGKKVKSIAKSTKCTFIFVGWY